jgi:hypothetical protein
MLAVHVLQVERSRLRPPCAEITSVKGNGTALKARRAADLRPSEYVE